MSTIEPFIHRKVVILRSDTPSHQVARVMCERGIGSVIITDQEGNLAGIVTDRDLSCDILGSGKKPDTPISEVMSTKPVSVDEASDVRDVVRLMEKNGIRRVPVHHSVGNKKRCVGLVTLDDLISAKTVDYERVAAIVRRQLLHRGIGTFARRTARNVSERGEARRSQTANVFYKTVAEKTGLAQELAEGVTRYILGCLTQRMHYTGATHLIAQLPAELQDLLLALPPGPDRSITVASILAGLEQKFKLSGTAGQLALQRTFEALMELVDPPEIDHVKSQLPLELQNLFARQKPAA